MANKVMQFRFYNEPQDGAATKNVPADLTGDSLVNGSAFSSYTPKLQLGIQTLPGTMFYLSAGQPDPIIVGKTGIFELDLNGDADISNLHFDRSSIDLINDNDSAYLIIDLLYGSEEVN